VRRSLSSRLIPINTAPRNGATIKAIIQGDRVMIGITLSSEQIRNAPAEVRRWIEREVTTSMGSKAVPEKAGEPRGERLAACGEAEITAILSQIQSVLPAVNVLFEFGRQGALLGQSNVEIFQLLDIAHHTRLQNIGQVISCLDIICEAFDRVRGDPDATFCGFDREGHCFIAQETQQNILKVWRKVIANQELIAADQSARLPSALATRDADVTEATLQTAPGQTDMNVSGAVAHP
jgi:hypothetical protein